jgi:hypothetical protein
MSKRDQELEFAAMARGRARRYQMPQKAPKEEIPSLLAEFTNRTQSVAIITDIEDFLETLIVNGARAKDLAKCFHWLEVVKQGESARLKIIKELLPDQDAEIKFGPEEPATPAPDPEPADVKVGVIEMTKGEPVLGSA